MLHSGLVRTQRTYAFFTVTIPTIACIFAVVLSVLGSVSPVDLMLFLTFYFFTLMGISVGFHRLFAHRSFKTGTLVAMLFAVFGTWAGQGPLVHWVSNHRRHHKFSDKPGDPHSPNLHGSGFWNKLKGCWHAHIGSMFACEVTNYAVYSPDILRNKPLMWINNHYLTILMSGLLLPAVIGGLVSWDLNGAATGLLWGGLVRMFVVHHAIWSITSVAHVFGNKANPSDDESRNSFVLAMLTGGEGWHNNHHAFPSAAIMSRTWWRVDLGGLVIGTLEKSGLAWDVRRLPPTVQTDSPPALGDETDQR
jgi:stearoyl-CoA desaturase (delta-9 desaturase)